MLPRTLTALLLALLLVLLPVGAASTVRAQGLTDNPLLLDSPNEPLPALDFSAQTLSGKTVRLSQFRGKVVLVNFWATWCVPCLIEMPALDRLNRKLSGQPFVLLAVNQSEDRAQVERFTHAHPYSFDVVLDPIGEISSNYRANRLPMTYIIDQDGMVIRRAIGPRQWDGPDALHLFETLMGETDAPVTPGKVSLAR
jgi:thiol-disulfide isomerase/thioredoxin